MLPLSADGELVDMILVGHYGRLQHAADGRQQQPLPACGVGIARAVSAPGGLAGEAG